MYVVFRLCSLFLAGKEETHLLKLCKRLLVEKRLVNCETRLVCLWSKGWSEGCRTVCCAVHQTSHLSPPGLGECVLCTGEIVHCAGKVLSRGWLSVTHLLGQPQPPQRCGGVGRLGPQVCWASELWQLAWRMQKQRRSRQRRTHPMKDGHAGQTEVGWDVLSVGEGGTLEKQPPQRAPPPPNLTSQSE